MVLAMFDHVLDFTYRWPTLTLAIVFLLSGIYLAGGYGVGDLVYQRHGSVMEFIFLATWVTIGSITAWKGLQAIDTYSKWRRDFEAARRERSKR